MVLLPAAIGLVYLCHAKEGLRLAQFPLIFSLLVSVPVNFLCSWSLLQNLSIFMQVLALLVSGWIFSYGDPNFDQYPQNGKFDVGYKRIRTDKYDNEVLVLYPVVKGTSTSDKSIRNKLSFIDKENEKEYMLGLGRAIRIGQKPFEVKEVNKGYYRFLMDAVINFTKKDAPLNTLFENGD